MIESLVDRQAYLKRKERCWEKNSSYWLNNPLRHVIDIGDYIVEKVIEICTRSEYPKSTIVDMGFGSAWLYEALLNRGVPCHYIGLDSNEHFVNHARSLYAEDKFCSFELIDFEEPLNLDLQADLVVNAFTFFELSQLEQPMANAYNLLASNGSLLISTIDSTYLILAVSHSWSEFQENLARYENIPGTKYAFQPIDLGDRESSTLEYPSVFYSRDDYITIGKDAGFRLASYKEHIFTSKPIPKIYFHLELIKVEG